MKKIPYTHLDVNELAASVVKKATEEKPPDDQPAEIPADTKNPHAVALGRLGGLKGGPARKKKLSKKRRSEIAKKAAQSRWSKSK